MALHTKLGDMTPDEFFESLLKFLEENGLTIASKRDVVRKKDREASKVAGEKENLIVTIVKPAVLDVCENVYNLYKNGKVKKNEIWKLDRFVDLLNGKLNARGHPSDVRNRGIFVDGVQINIQTITESIRERFGRDALLKPMMPGGKRSDYLHINWIVVFHQLRMEEEERGRRAKESISTTTTSEDGRNGEGEEASGQGIVTTTAQMEERKEDRNPDNMFAQTTTTTALRDEARFDRKTKGRAFQRDTSIFHHRNGAY